MSDSHPLPRRSVVRMLGGLAVLPLLPDAATTRASTERFVPPVSPRAVFSMNPGWKFRKADVPGASAPGFDDASWETISTPHTYNEADTFDEIITRSGEHHQYMGAAWYRKRFRIPSAHASGKVFIEFEGLRQAAQFFLNGKPVGLYENGVTACGLDITDAAHFGDQENVLAVRADSSRNYAEQATGVAFEWNSRDFNPVYGGLNRNVRLHLTGKVYHTLPLYENLKTVGIYVYATDISVPRRTATITVESEVRNESGAPRTLALSAVIVDAEGIARATLKSEPATLAAGETRVLTARGPLSGVNLWDDRTPYLYDVYSVLTAGDAVLDVSAVRTGFRKTEFRGGAGKGGVYLNGRFVYLKGYAQRSTNEWAGLGAAYPDWMHDYTASLVRASNANYLRWMHVTPQRADVTACDRHGIIEIAPAGDKERDAQGRQWEQRLEVMRASMIYLRNHPSILLWEAGNNSISGEHMQQMHDLRLRWDPHGGRAIGCRTIEDEAAVAPAEYYGTMVAMDDRIHQPRAYSAYFRGYSDERRDRAPLIEAEDFRDEGARRFWDDFSPPHFGFKPKPEDTYHWNSETFAVAAVKRYHAYDAERISNPDPARSKWSGYASIIFADSNSHGRQYGSEVCRVSGKVDAVRLPKQAFYTYRVMQNPQPDIHILGHWTYPAETRKTVYVVSNCPAVELFVKGKSLGIVKQPTDGFLFAFPNVSWKPGEIKAVGLVQGRPTCAHTLTTTGPPKRLRLTPLTGPGGWRADGSDIALIDVEVVDAQGRRCPTDEARVDFVVAGSAIWRGGYNSGIPGSTNNRYLSTECGINRGALRSTLTPGTVTLTASRAGLEPGTLRLASRPLAITDGLAPETLLFGAQAG